MNLGRILIDFWVGIERLTDKATYDSQGYFINDLNHDKFILTIEK